MDKNRIILSAVVPLIVFVVRCIIVPAAHGIWPVCFGKPTAVLDKAKVAATIGWDFTSVGCGFYLAALLSSGSFLNTFQPDNVVRQNAVVIVSLMIFALMYLVAVFVRFSLIEAWPELESIHKFTYGFVSFVLGVFMVGTLSKLALSDPNHAPKPGGQKSAVVQTWTAPRQEDLWTL